jgi:hypothetical protein
MNVLGLEIDAEVSVSQGSVDAVLELDDKVYVIEFKHIAPSPDATAEDKKKLLDKALNKGMEQIEAKGYHKKYSGSDKSVYLTAFAFLGRDELEMRFKLQE